MQKEIIKHFPNVQLAGLSQLVNLPSNVPTTVSAVKIDGADNASNFFFAFKVPDQEHWQLFDIRRVVGFEICEDYPDTYVNPQFKILTELAMHCFSDGMQFETKTYEEYLLQSFCPQPVNYYKEQFDLTMNRILDPDNSSIMDLMLIDIDEGIRMFLGVFDYPSIKGIPAYKELNVIARRMKGQPMPATLELCSPCAFIAILSDNQLMETKNITNTGQGNWIITYAID